MSAKGWDACVQVLRHQPPHLRPRSLDVYVYWTPSTAALEQDTALMRNVLPVLLDRKLFPTLTELCVEPSEPEHTIWLLGLLTKSNVRTLIVNAFGNYIESLPVVAPCLRQAHGLERFEFSVGLDDEEDITAYLEPFIAGMTCGAAGPRGLRHLSASMQLSHNNDLHLPTAASSWRLLLMPSLVTFMAVGDGECWLTPDHLLVLEQCLRARQSYGYTPLESIKLDVDDLRDGSLLGNGAEKVWSIVSALSPSTTAVNG